MQSLPPQSSRSQRPPMRLPLGPASGGPGSLPARPTSHGPGSLPARSASGGPGSLFPVGPTSHGPGVPQTQPYDCPKEYYCKIYDNRDLKKILKDYIFHKYLYLLNKAPDVYGLKPHGTGHILIMEKMDGAVGHYKTQKFSDDFKNLLRRSGQQTQLINQLVEFVKSLATVGLKHGDLCLPNIVYKVSDIGSVEFKVIDFEFSSLYGHELGYQDFGQNCYGLKLDTTPETRLFINSLQEELTRENFQNDISGHLTGVPMQEFLDPEIMTDRSPEEMRNMQILYRIIKHEKTNFKTASIYIPQLTSLLTDIRTSLRHIS